MLHFYDKLFIMLLFIPRDPSSILKAVLEGFVFVRLYVDKGIKGHIAQL